MTTIILAPPPIKIQQGKIYQRKPQPANGYAEDLLDEALYRLTVEQYHAMIETGILTDDDPVELLEGRLFYKMSKKPRHRGITWRVAKRLEQVLVAGWFVALQDPVTMDDSEPEPDVVIVRGESDDYMTHHPTPTDVGLVVEVSDSTLQVDQGRKKRLYARVNIPVYWVVNLVDNVVEVYRTPTNHADGPEYAEHHTFSAADELPLVLDGHEITRLSVAELLK